MISNRSVRMDLDGFTQYDDFEEEFKPKKTTDDCYKPPEVYGAAGLDYAELSDWTSLVLLFRRDEERLAICHTRICAESKTLHRVKAQAQAQIFALSPRELALVEELTKQAPEE